MRGVGSAPTIRSVRKRTPPWHINVCCPAEPCARNQQVGDRVDDQALQALLVESGSLRFACGRKGACETGSGAFVILLDGAKGTCCLLDKISEQLSCCGLMVLTCNTTTKGLQLALINCGTAQVRGACPFVCADEGSRLQVESAEDGVAVRNRACSTRRRQV